MKDEKLHISLSDPELPDFLKDARRNNCGMTVPEDFFAQFEKKMNAVIDEEEARKAEEVKPVIGRREVAKPSVLNPHRWVGIAAVVAIVVAIRITLQFDFSSEGETDNNGNVAAAYDGGMLQSDEAIVLPEQVADELMASASDYDIFELYCDI